jgi:hypothetical protein
MESTKNAHMLAAVMAMVFGEVVMVDAFALSAIPAPAMVRVQPLTPVYTSLQPLTPRIQLVYAEECMYVCMDTQNTYAFTSQNPVPHSAVESTIKSPYKSEKYCNILAIFLNILFIVSLTSKHLADENQNVVPSQIC